MKREIVQKGNKVLGKISKEVDLSSGVPQKIQDLIKSMQEVLKDIPDGVALAAPQVGELIRLFVISPRAFEYMDESLSEKQNLVFINPIIKKKSFDKKKMEEGCLSVRGWYGHVKRSTRATIEAYDESGHKIEIEGVGLLAQIFQHETDHLDGVLFDSKAKNLKETPMDQYGQKI